MEHTSTRRRPFCFNNSSPLTAPSLRASSRIFWVSWPVRSGHRAFPQSCNLSLGTWQIGQGCKPWKPRVFDITHLDFLSKGIKREKNHVLLLVVGRQNYNSRKKLSRDSISAFYPTSNSWIFHNRFEELFKCLMPDNTTVGPMGCVFHIFNLWNWNFWL